MQGSSASLVAPDQALERFRENLPLLLRDNPFYRGRLHSVRDWEDFQRLPFTTKSELVADQAANPPFGTNLTFPLDRYTRLHQTSGSAGGSPLRWLDTPESWEWWERIWAEHVFAAAGVSARDRIFFAFSFGPFIGFWSAFGGAERLGALAFSGGAMTTEQRLRAIIELGATVLCCTPTYALRLAEAGEAASSAVRTLVCAGEPGASIPATREALEKAWGARVFDHTGMTELGPTGVSCSAGGGVHLIQSEFIFEVSSEGGESRAGSSGSDSPRGEAPLIRGELIATNLGRWGSPLIRYRTGDRVELSSQPCACGSPFTKLVGGIQGRLDDMITVRGVNLFPSQVEEIVRRHPEIVEWRLEHRLERAMDEVTLAYEASSPVTGLAEELRVLLGVRIDCREVPDGTLPRSELKSKRLVHL